MSHRRIKTKNPKNSGGPLDWIRTDDKSMEDCFYILLMTRGMYSVLEALCRAIDLEADASRHEKAAIHPGWINNAEFCEEAFALIRNAAESLHEKWDSAAEEDMPNTARRKEAVIGGMYPLPGAGVYIPKKPAH